MVWEWIKFLAMWTGFFCWGGFLYITLWCTVCAINDRRRDKAIQDRIDRIGSV